MTIDGDYMEEKRKSNRGRGVYVAMKSVVNIVLIRFKHIQENTLGQNKINPRKRIKMPKNPQSSTPKFLEMCQLNRKDF